MELPPELARMLPGSLAVLRYLGSEQIEGADSDTLAEGAGMSSRGVMKAIRALVTQGFLQMDANYVYYLTDKGNKAIVDLADYDATQPADANDAASDDDSPEVESELIAVLPDPIGAQQTTSLQIGLAQIPDVNSASQLVLRLSATAGTISPQEISLDLKPGQAPPSAEAVFRPSGQVGQIRFRIEAVQILSMDDVHPAGGMFLDARLDQAQGDLQAWYGSLTLKSQ
jgi:predicted transcriptional regulator